MVSCRCIVEGRVQGVGFRYFTARAARELGVSGWVRNLPGGSVEIRAEGPPDPVQRFLDRVRQGPAFSRVTRLQVEDAAPENLSGFQIEV